MKPKEKISETILTEYRSNRLSLSEAREMLMWVATASSINLDWLLQEFERKACHYEHLDDLSTAEKTAIIGQVLSELVQQYIFSDYTYSIAQGRSGEL